MYTKKIYVYTFNKAPHHSVGSIYIRALFNNLWKYKSNAQETYLSDIKVAFQVISNYAVEFICRVKRGFCRFCGDLKGKTD